MEFDPCLDGFTPRDVRGGPADPPQDFVTPVDGVLVALDVGRDHDEAPNDIADEDDIDRYLDMEFDHDEDYFDFGGGSDGRCDAAKWWEQPHAPRKTPKRRGALRRWAARDDKRGPFTGKHTYVPNPVLPPEWDMTPAEYRRALARDEDPGGWVAPSAAGVTAAASGAVVWPNLLGQSGTVSDSMALVMFVAVAAHMCGVAATASGTYGYLRWRRHDFGVLGDKDPARAISITDLPDEPVQVLLNLLDMNDSTSTAPPVSTVQRAERLHLSYRCAAAFTNAFKAQGTIPIAESPLAFLYRHCRAELIELAEYASTVSDPWTKREAAKLTLQLAILESAINQREPAATVKDIVRHHNRAKHQTGCLCPDCGDAAPATKHSVPVCDVCGIAAYMQQAGGVYVCRACGSATYTAEAARLDRERSHADARLTPAPPAVLSAQQRWDNAVATHEQVINAWTKIVTDPLAALDHTLLLDVTQPRTAAFIETYGAAQDLAAIHGTRMPSDEAEQRAYCTAVRKADEAWTEAVRHAKHVHLNWLPEAEEKRTRRAKGLLSTAADDTVPMHLRAEAAKKAADLLAKVASFVMPPAAMEELETSLRALEASTTTPDAPGLLSTTEVLTPMVHTEPA